MATPARRRNKITKDGGSNSEKIPEEMKFYDKTYVCMHAGAPIQNNHLGERPNQHSRRIGCKAQVLIFRL
ncbi:hypothetical protein JG688_00013965 [Phytophthora aleatoria]|uniref:Uncharacterized protein n=1 Tax=Phytophthora aleatoria TaxID=2496075 RepID=A0A8J5J125_9STRA|nr:hypothetical protein JG688_00013965 [Phytophthora aleatoria]